MDAGSYPALDAKPAFCGQARHFGICLLRGSEDGSGSNVVPFVLWLIVLFRD